MSRDELLEEAFGIFLKLALAASVVVLLALLFACGRASDECRIGAPHYEDGCLHIVVDGKDMDAYRLADREQAATLYIVEDCE
jgi:hypothetical protein